MEESANEPRNALPHLPRPVFISYSRRDFRIAYYLWQQMLSSESTDTHNEQILMDFPPLTPPDMKLGGYQASVSAADHPLGFGAGYEDEWSPGMPGWMVAIGGGLIRSQSLAVVLTPNSEHSQAVNTELEAFNAFPDKPIAFLSVNRTPIPERYARYDRAIVHDVTIDIGSVMGNVLRAAFEAQNDKKWVDAGLLFTEALHLLPLFPDASAALCREILTCRGRADVELGYRDQAIQMFGQALHLTDPGQHTVRASILYNLGQAHAMQARDQIGWSRESVAIAKTCWERAMAALEEGTASGDESVEAATLRDSIQEAQRWATELMEVDPRLMIPAVLQAAGRAEEEGDWAAMREQYGEIFSLYRLGGDCDSAIAADMLSARARAERRLEAWEDAQRTLKFALAFIGDEDSASRAGLLYDLGCVHSRRGNDHPEDLSEQQFAAAFRCWTEAHALAARLLAGAAGEQRFDVAGLARACEQALAWLRLEIEHRVNPA